MSMMDLIGQMGGQQGTPQGLPPEGPPPEGPEESGSHADMIRDILNAAREAAQVADDEQEALTWEKITTMIQQILAQQEKQDQDMMQGKISPAALRRAIG